MFGIEVKEFIFSVSVSIVVLIGFIPVAIVAYIIRGAVINNVTNFQQLVLCLLIMVLVKAWISYQRKLPDMILMTAYQFYGDDNDENG